MPKAPKKKASATTTRESRRSAKRVKHQGVRKPKPAPSARTGKLAFNHAVIYVKDVERGRAFYRDLLGFKLIEEFRYQDRPVYARLCAPEGDNTIALHQAETGVSTASEGVRLYFEVQNLDDFCRKLQHRGFYINQMPRMMPWGWRHAYLNDPDGHEISLYWAGENRMKKTMVKAIEKAAERKPKTA